MTREMFVSLVQAYRGMGGQYVEVTGGEPTLHPQVTQLLEDAHAAGCETILCTNGLRLDRILPAAQAGWLALVRLSMHHDGSSPARAKELLGSAWDFKGIRDNVAPLLALRVPIQLVFTHTGENHDQLDAVLRLALEWGVDVQVVDIIATRVEDPSSRLGYRTGQESEVVAARYAVLEQVITDRTGAVLRLYRTQGGASWEVKDYHFGVLHSAMCNGCTLRDKCGEGVYALRVDSLGVVKPCLLRSDLERTLPVSELGSLPVRPTLEGMLTMMLQGPLEWSYGDVVAVKEVPNNGPPASR